MAQPYFFSTSHRNLVKVWIIWNLEANLTLCCVSSNRSSTIFEMWIILLKGATAIRKYIVHEGIHHVSNNVQVCGTCQGNIYMNGRTQGFPAENCTKHLTIPTGLPSSHRASWSHLFSRKLTHTISTSHPQDVKENVINQTSPPSSIALWPSSDIQGSSRSKRLNGLWATGDWGYSTVLGLGVLKLLYPSQFGPCNLTFFCFQHMKFRNKISLAA